MGEFNFNSQICTDKNQSERLLALGLKKKTADCFLMLVGDLGGADLYTIRFGAPYDGWIEGVIPAWSLDRLKELYKCVGDTSLWNLDDVNYNRLIQCIGLAIKHNSFNKEYLV